MYINLCVLRVDVLNGVYWYIFFIALMYQVAEQAVEYWAW